MNATTPIARLNLSRLTLVSLRIGVISRVMMINWRALSPSAASRARKGSGPNWLLTASQNVQMPGIGPIT